MCTKSQRCVLLLTFGTDFGTSLKRMEKGQFLNGIRKMDDKVIRLSLTNMYFHGFSHIKFIFIVEFHGFYTVLKLK
jgi:hypothetical protein